PIVAFRKTSLEALIAKSPKSETTQRALEAALDSRAPELQIIGAQYLDSESAKRALREIARSEEAPHEIRAQALLHLAATEPSAEIELFMSALQADSDAVQVAA